MHGLALHGNFIHFVVSFIDHCQPTGTLRHVLVLGAVCPFPSSQILPRAKLLET